MRHLNRYVIQLVPGIVLSQWLGTGATKEINGFYFGLGHI